MHSNVLQIAADRCVHAPLRLRDARGPLFAVCRATTSLPIFPSAWMAKPIDSAVNLSSAKVGSAQ